MKTLTAAIIAALLAAVVTATAADRGEPVHDAQAVKQLKRVNRNVTSLSGKLDALAQKQERANNLIGDKFYDHLDVRNVLDAMNKNLHTICRANTSASASFELCEP